MSIATVPPHAEKENMLPKNNSKGMKMHLLMSDSQEVKTANIAQFPGLI